ncbi:unnamed protein product [Meloidogyne enterolobii]|uniref:Uncharacterized protein n=2 Tax=Meloidogyne enterolobii TaxID=390850 RepID=A0ACB0ZYF0_MELEN
MLVKSYFKQKILKASKAHTQTFMVRIFIETIPKIEDIAVRHVMEDILWLYLTYELVHSSEGFLSSHQMSIIRKKLFTSLAKIRPNSVALVDSFDFTDRELRSVLGRKDGQVYENLLEWAKKSPLNEHDVRVLLNYRGNFKEKDGEVRDTD